MAAQRRGVSTGGLRPRSGSPPVADMRAKQRDASLGATLPRRPGTTQALQPRMGGRRDGEFSASPAPVRKRLAPVAIPQADAWDGDQAGGLQAEGRPQSLAEAIERITAGLVHPSHGTDCAEGDISGTGGGRIGDDKRSLHGGGGSVAQALAVLPQLLQVPQMLADLNARVARMERSGFAADDIGHTAGGGLPPSAEESLGAGAASAPANHSRAGSLHQWTSRLEHEVADLRAQVARRLDIAARENALCRRDADNARAEAASLRKEVADLVAEIGLPGRPSAGGSASATAPVAPLPLAALRSGGNGRLPAAAEDEQGQTPTARPVAAAPQQVLSGNSSAMAGCVYLASGRTPQRVQSISNVGCHGS